MLKGLGATCVAVAICAGIDQRVEPRGATTLKTLTSLERVLAVVPWMVGRDALLCVVSERQITVSGETGPARFLTVYEMKQETLTPVFDFQTLDSFVKAAPLFETGGRLFTVWSGGSAYHFRAYAWKEGSVRQVLETGSRGMPEIQIDGDENEWILVTEKTLIRNQWRRTRDSATRIYRWDGNTYQVLATVPWRTRFEAVSARMQSGQP